MIPYFRIFGDFILRGLSALEPLPERDRTAESLDICCGGSTGDAALAASPGRSRLIRGRAAQFTHSCKRAHTFGQRIMHAFVYVCVCQSMHECVCVTVLHRVLACF